MQLPSGHRREIIEDLLDIKIFSVMNDVLKQKHKDVTDSIAAINGEIEIGKTKVKLQQEYIKTLEEDKQKKVDDVQKRILETTADIAKYNDSVAREKQKEASLQSSIADQKEKQGKRVEMESLLRKLTEKVKNTQKSIAFYEQHDVCPTCSQEIGEERKLDSISVHEHKIEEVQNAIGALTKEIESVEARLDEIAAIEEYDSIVKRLSGSWRR